MPIALLGLLMPVYSVLVVVATKFPLAFLPIVPVPKASMTIRLRSSNASAASSRAVPLAVIHRFAPPVWVLLLRAMDLFVLARLVIISMNYLKIIFKGFYDDG